LDLGQAQDFTALAVMEHAEFVGERDPVTYERVKETRLRLRHVERMPLGTRYPKVVERVTGLVGSRELAGRCGLAVDATGVGRPVGDLLEGAGLACKLWPVTITGGQGETSAGGYCGVPKRDLVVGLQVLIQNGELEIAAGMKWLGELVREMRHMRMKMGENGERFGVWQTGEHDDLVMAVALAGWAAKRVFPVWGFGRARIV